MIKEEVSDEFSQFYPKGIPWTLDLNAPTAQWHD